MGFHGILGAQHLQSVGSPQLVFVLKRLSYGLFRPVGSVGQIRSEVSHLQRNDVRLENKLVNSAADGFISHHRFIFMLQLAGAPELVLCHFSPRKLPADEAQYP